jgi:glycosyltransferase involved in cell wall biosynthesis
VHHFPNGVDLRRFRPAAAPPAGCVFGTVGGLRGEKDHENLLRAFAQGIDGASLCLVGGGPLEPVLRTLAREFGIDGRTQFVGPVADTAPHYAAMSVFVLSSRTEQMPIAMLEAMACGLPVVATDVGDVRTILPAEAGEFVVPPGDPKLLAAALQKLAGDAPLRRSLGAANRRRVEERYEAGACLGRFVALYERTARAKHS